MKSKEVIVNIKVVLTEREVAVLNFLKKRINYEPLNRADMPQHMGVEFAMLCEKSLIQFNTDSNAYSLTYYGLSSMTHPEMQGNTITVTKADLKTFAMDMAMGGEFSDTSYPLLTFIGIDPTKGT